MTQRPAFGSTASVRSMAVAALAFSIVVAGAACGKKETAGGSAAAPSPVAVAPTPAPGDVEPKISSKAQAGSGPFAGLDHPRAIALDDKGRLWIADFGHAAVRVFDTTGALFGGWGGRGEGTYGMKDPCGIAVWGDDVYVADTWRTGVERFSTTGELKAKANADLYAPHGVAVGADGKVYITDTGDNRIVICDADLTNPKNFGKNGPGREEFSGPMGIAVGPSGNVYVADAGNKRVQVLDAQGRFKSRFPVDAWGEGTEGYLTVDADESVFVSNPAGQTVLHYDRDGKLLKRWADDGTGKKFERPSGLAVDPKSRVLYVMNTDSGTVSRLEISK